MSGFLFAGKASGGAAKHEPAGSAPGSVGKLTLVQNPPGANPPGRAGRRAIAEPLPAGVRTRMERLFGTSFAQVRISESPDVAARGAQAVTEGQHIQFAPGYYDPDSAEGQELLGHELAHVVQQTQGDRAAGGAGLEHEADEQGARAARGERAVVAGGAPVAPQCKLFTYTSEVARGQPLAPRQALFGPTGTPYRFVSSYPEGNKLIIEDAERLLHTYNFDDDLIAPYAHLDHDAAVGRRLIGAMHAVNQTGGPDHGVHYEHAYLDAYPDLWRDEFTGGYAAPEYFDKLDNMRWQLKAGRSAARALRAWLAGLTIAECATGLVALQLESVLQIIGDAKFDQMYGSERPGVVPSVKPLLICGDLSQCVPPAALKLAGQTQQGHPVFRLGAQYYFQNHAAYLRKHPDGAMRGENAVFYGVQGQGQERQLMFGGFGIAPVSAGGMCEILRREYNLPRTEGDYRELILQVSRITPEVLTAELQARRTFAEIYHRHIGDIHPTYHLGDHTPDQLSADEWHADPTAGIKDEGIMLNPALYLMAVQYDA